MTNSQSKVVFYIPFLLILFTVYRNSILPGAYYTWSKDVFIIFLGCLFYFLIIFDFNSFLKLKLNFFGKYNKYIFLLILLFMISTFFFNDQEIRDVNYLVRLLDFIFYFIIYYFIVPNFLISDPYYLKKMVRLIANFGLFTAVIGFFMMYLQLYTNMKYIGFMTSFVGHPNFVPVIFNVGALSALYYIDLQKTNLSANAKYFYYASVFIQVLASVLTYTRAGYIGLAAGLTMYFLFKYRFKFIYLFPVIAFVGVFIIPSYFSAKGYSSFVSRLYLLIPVYDMMFSSTTKLLWGYGLTDTFKVYLDYNLYNPVGEYYINNPHNAVASLFLMFGIIFSLIILMFLTFNLIKFTMLSVKTKTPQLQLLYGYIVSMLLSYIFLSLFDSSVLMPEFFNMQLFLIFWGLIYYLNKPQVEISLVSAI